MILDKDVEVLVSNRDISYYESLGYDVPRVKNCNGKMVVKRGTKIRILIDHLKKYSRLVIRRKCDTCGDVREINYKDYGIGLCVSCSSKRSGKKSPFYKGGVKAFCEDCGKHLKNYKAKVCLKCHGKRHTGKNNPRWNVELTDNERKIQRNYDQYRKWRREIYRRDDYICRKCRKRGRRLNAHHIESYSKNPEKRLKMDNGVTLCERCHKDFHKEYGNTSFDQKDFYKFIGV